MLTYNNYKFINFAISHIKEPTVHDYRYFFTFLLCLKSLNIHIPVNIKRYIFFHCAIHTEKCFENYIQTTPLYNTMIRKIDEWNYIYANLKYDKNMSRFERVHFTQLKHQLYDLRNPNMTLNIKDFSKEILTLLSNYKNTILRSTTNYLKHNKSIISEFLRIPMIDKYLKDDYVVKYEIDKLINT